MSFHCKPVAIQGCREAGYQRCVQCGHLFVPGELAAIGDLGRICEATNSQRAAAQLPSYAAMASHYIQAYAKWRAEGKPVLALPQIVERFQACSTCPAYSDLSGQCIQCGCFVNLLHAGQGMNKLEWATEQCPNNPPRW